MSEHGEKVLSLVADARACRERAEKAWGVVAQLQAQLLAARQEAKDCDDRLIEALSLLRYEAVGTYQCGGF